MRARTRTSCDVTIFLEPAEADQMESLFTHRSVLLLLSLSNLSTQILHQQKGRKKREHVLQYADFTRR